MGLLSDLNRAARRVPARRPPAPPSAPEGNGAAGPRGPRGPRGHPPLAAVLTTGPDGRATWRLPPGAVAGPPVVGALAAGPAPAVVTVEATSAEEVVVRVWLLAPRRAPAGEGVPVHVTATPQSAS